MISNDPPKDKALAGQYKQTQAQRIGARRRDEHASDAKPGHRDADRELRAQSGLEHASKELGHDVANRWRRNQPAFLLCAEAQVIAHRNYQDPDSLADSLVPEQVCGDEHRM